LAESFEEIDDSSEDEVQSVGKPVKGRLPTRVPDLQERLPCLCPEPHPPEASKAPAEGKRASRRR